MPTTVTTKRRQRIHQELNLNLEPAARAILDKYAPPRSYFRGRFLARLLYEFEAREEEKRRWQQGAYAPPR